MDNKMIFPEDLEYTKRHEWCRKLEDGTIVLGVTDYPLRKLSDALLLELPSVGDDVLSDVALGEIESSDELVDLYCPFDGEVLEINERALDEPEIIREDPYNDGWLVRIRPESMPADKERLFLSAEEYAEYIKQVESGSAKAFEDEEDS